MALVTGCEHTDLCNLINGYYVPVGKLCGREAYKSVTGEVFLYFWVGEKWDGWWMGPKIGSSEFWAHNPDTGPLPLRTGWKLGNVIEESMEVVSLPVPPPPPVAKHPQPPPPPERVYMKHTSIRVVDGVQKIRTKKKQVYENNHPLILARKAHAATNRSNRW